MKLQRKPGRPPIQEKKLDKTLALRLSSEVYDFLSKIANKEGKSVSVLIREMIVKNLGDLKA